MVAQGNEGEGGAHFTAAELALWPSALRARVCRRELRLLLTALSPNSQRALSAQELLTALFGQLADALAELARIAERKQQVEAELADAAGDRRKQAAVLRGYLLETETDPWRRRGDLAALDRWFDLEAVLERELFRENRATQGMLLVLEMLSRLAREAPWLELSPGDVDTLQVLVGANMRSLLREQSLLCMAAWGRFATAGAQGLRSPSVLGSLEALCGDREKHPYTQIAGLTALMALAEERARAACRMRLSERAPGDDFIVRAYALKVLSEQAALRPSADELVALSAADPSEHVRQRLVVALSRLSDSSGLLAVASLCGKDGSARVVSEGLRVLARAAAADESQQPLFERALLDAVAAQSEPIALRGIFDLVVDWLEQRRTFAQRGELGRALAGRITAELDPVLAEQAVHVLTTLELSQDPSALERSLALRSRLLGATEGERIRLFADDTVAERELLLAARGGLPVSLTRSRRGARLTVGERRRPRLWKLWHELTHPAPDKRKGYSHVSARVTRDELVIPPTGMAELTPTSVPGERRLISRLGTWGPWLPRVDDVLTALSRRMPVTIVTNLAIVKVVPPSTVRLRARARARLTRKYAHYAALRDASLAALETTEQAAYVRALRRDLGVGIEVTPRAGEVGGQPYRVQLPHVSTTLDQAGLLVPPVFDALTDYVLSDEGNTSSHLAFAVLAVFVYILLRAALAHVRQYKARESFPLSIGGWGTRGKSGTERIKAGLFQGLGYEVYVKTTGCEAMCIHAMPGKVANEIFLYRPYDKATIWEQFHVVVMAAGLKAQVFLWECMALNPRFVALLSHQWMRDDYNTLTNAYPDHEDIQGPAGEDVARTIAQFMKPQGICFSTEDQMLPLLRDRALRSGVDFRWVDHWASDRISPELLDRYPYQEHPRNIALVTRMAEELGVDPVRAIWEMADHVVADLGVLKTYPTVQRRGRSADMSNLMSANERAGCLASWERLGLHQHDPAERPEFLPIIVVNNRADRVPRSRVFARIIVRDLKAAHVVSVGTNLGGLCGFIEQELDSWLDEESVARDGESSERRLARFDAYLKRLKIVHGVAPLRAEVTRILGALGWEPPRAQAVLAQGFAPQAEPEKAAIMAALKAELADAQDVLAAECAAHIEAALDRHARLCELRTKLAKAPADEANALFRKSYRELMLARHTPLWEPTLKGDQVLERIFDLVPPGHHARLVGVQNIKGTGLDFIYRWVSIDAVRGWTTKLLEQPSARDQMLSALAGHGDYGVIDAREAIDACERVLSELTDSQRVSAEALIARLGQLERSGLAKLRTQATASRGAKLLSAVERWVDFLDSIARRRDAERLVADLVTQRIGHGRAALVMRELTSRGKGGWLAKRLQGRRKPQ